MARVTIALPEGLDEQRALGEDWAGWLDRLPRLFTRLLGGLCFFPALALGPGMSSLSRRWSKAC